MKILESLFKLQFSEAATNDLSRLPADVLKSIKTNIRKGAEDLNQDWGNALELLQKAYEVEGVQRPSPSMEAGWKQYEENLQYAVQQLAKNRGLDGDWRMSAAMFHEALNLALKPLPKFEVMFDNDYYITEGRNPQEIIDHLVDQVSTLGIETIVTENDGNQELQFKRFGIKNPNKVVIKRI